MCYLNRMLDVEELDTFIHPEEELLVKLWKDKAAFDALQTTANPFAVPGLREVTLGLCDRNKVPLGLISSKGLEPFDDALYTEGCPLAASPAVSIQGMVITFMDPASRMLGGYHLTSFGCHSRRMYFDRLLWDDLGQPLDGRALFLSSPLFSEPFVLTEDRLLVGTDHRRIGRPPFFFTNEDAKSQIEAVFEEDFLTKPRERSKVPLASLSILSALKDKAQTRHFSLSDLQNVLDGFKERILCEEKYSVRRDLYRCDNFALPLYGFLTEADRLVFCAVIPECGIVLSREWEGDMRWDNICRKYGVAKNRGQFLCHHTEQSIVVALDLFEEATGLKGQKVLSSPTMATITYLGRYWDKCLENTPWASRRYSRLAAMLIKFRKTPCSLDSPNAHLLCDDEIGQWLPADFKVTRQNINGVLSFIHGVLNDLRDLDAPMVAGLFQKDFSEGQAQTFELSYERLQLSDLELDGYFLNGRLTAAADYGLTLWEAHCIIKYGNSGYSRLKPSFWNTLPFACKEDIHIDGYIFSSVKQLAQYHQARIYCGLPGLDWFDGYDGRLFAAVVSREEAPRIPIGVVHAPQIHYMAPFELSGEFYSLNDSPKAQQDAAFAQVVESYWTILDKKFCGAY